MAAGEDDAKRLLDFSLEHETEKLSSYGDTRLTNSIGTRRSEPSSDAPASSENIHEEVKSKGLSSTIKSISVGNVAFLHQWTDVLVILCVIATLLDPFFCYILVVDEKGNCIRFEEKLRVAIVVLRSLIDICYIILIILHFRTDYIRSYDANDGRQHVAMRYLFSHFTIDILAVLPVAQVVIFFVIPTSKAPHFATAVMLMKKFLGIQYVPRVVRAFTVLKKVRWSSDIFPNSAGAKAIFNLFLYLLASHVFGAFWYLFSIERRATCLQETCHNHPYCPKSYNNSSLEGWCIDACSAKTSSNNTETFNFGIFDDAFKSGVVYSTNFIGKLSYCYWWGLQNLSSFGQGLKTSTHIWEIYFAATITITGLVSFALLLGNLQTFLQAPFARQEELRLRGLDIKRWMPYRSLPKDLKKKIKQYENYKWQKTRGIDVENILHDLPRELRRDITRYLCSSAIESVPMFQRVDKKFLDAIYDYLKPMLYIEGSFIIQEGEPLDEMIFIIDGKLSISPEDGETSCSSGHESLEKECFFGEDLLKWVLEDPVSSTGLTSTKTVCTRTEVEAFVLHANDLKRVISKFPGLFSRPEHEDREKQKHTDVAAVEGGSGHSKFPLATTILAHMNFARPIRQRRRMRNGSSELTERCNNV